MSGTPSFVQPERLAQPLIAMDRPSGGETEPPISDDFQLNRGLFSPVLCAHNPESESHCSGEPLLQKSAQKSGERKLSWTQHCVHQISPAVASADCSRDCQTPLWLQSRAQLCWWAGCSAAAPDPHIEQIPKDLPKSCPSLSSPEQPFSSHWKDDKHEPDGTSREFLVTDEKVNEEKSGYFRIGSNDGEEMLKLEMNMLAARYDGGVDCWDDVTGAPLIAKLVRAARALDMKFFTKMGVYSERLPRSVVKERGGKVIKGRWIDTNKGDSACPDYRSRFVGKEFNVGVDPELYAATPPLEALKLLLGHASSGDGLAHLMLSDVKRAYFHAKANRELYVELPEEDEEYHEGYVGKLALALYGTRDAASLWQECLAEHLLSIGFVRGISNPCVYYNADRQLRALVHGDDYATSGSLQELEWMRGKLEGRFEMKTTMVGHSLAPSVVREGKILNRIIRAMGI